MKKSIFILTVLLLLSGCVTTRNVDFSKVTFGMSKAQVRELIGSPERVLTARQTNQGYQEVLQYRTPYDEVYALEFWNDRLTGYEHLYDDIIYVPGPYPMYPPTWGYPLFPNYPPPGYPLPPVGRPQPEQPVRPDPAPRPPGGTNNPTQPTRPNPTQPERPGVSNPTQPSRPAPANPTTPSRPAETQRPVTRPSATPAVSPVQNTRPAPVSENTNSTRESGSIRSTESTR